jgi:hypothetical protein
MDRLFAVIAKINSVLLLIGLLGLCGVIAYSSWGSHQFSQRGEIAVAAADNNSKTAVLLQLEPIESIAGTDTEMLKLSARSNPPGFSSGPGYVSETRNALFLSGQDKKARWLFPTQSNVILVAAQLRQKVGESDRGPTQALYVEYVSQDTDGDGRLSAKDHSNVALTLPNGTGMADVLKGVSRVLSYELVGDKQLSVVYQVGNVIRHARISLSSMAKEIDQEVIAVPDRI